MILKFILCSTLFIALYKAVLENERMFRFNRFYLLFTLIAAVIIPFLTFTHTVEFIQIPVQYRKIISSQNIVQVNQSSESAISLETVLWIIYGIGFLYFSTNFLKNITQLFHIIKNSEKIYSEDYTLVILNKKVVPHSFLNYIFVSDAETIENNILLHEQTHIRQRHTWDILFIEIFKICFWFNPAVYFYRSSMMLNHEFLADEAALKSTNISIYQHLLLQNVMSVSFHSSVIHGFNYSIIKKRLIMMTQQKSQSRTVTKALLVTLLCTAIGFVFTEKVIAQASSTIEDRTGATEEELNEFYAIIEKYKDKNKRLDFGKLSNEEKKRLTSISNKMTPTQLFAKGEAYLFTSGKNIKPYKISNYDFDKWTTDKNYTVYIDSKKVSNASLKRWKIDDFQRHTLSSGKKDGKYKVNLITNNRANELSQKTQHNSNIIIVHAVYLDK